MGTTHTVVMASVSRLILRLSWLACVSAPPDPRGNAPWSSRSCGHDAVAKPGSDFPRYRIDLNIPIEIEESLSRDPDGGFAPWTPANEADYDRWVRTYERPQPQLESDPNPRPGSRRRLTCEGSSRSEPCADIVGGSPQPGRPGRRG